MANTNLTHGDVKSICDKLECSPMANFADSPYGGKSALIRGPVSGHAAGKQAGNLATHMSADSHKSTKVPGYKKGHAEKAKKT